MEQKTLDDQLMVRYLLGQLPEEEQLRLEERAFSDQEYLQNVLAVERDLIDEYVRGELSGVERRQFEKLFLASSDRRRKVEFARALVSVVSESPLSESFARPMIQHAPVSWWDSLLAWLRGPRMALKFSLAAAAMIVVLGVSWLIAETVRLRTQLAQLQAQQQSQQRNEEKQLQEEALRQQLAEQQKRNEELARQLQSERQHLARLQKELDKSSPTRPIIASLMLLPGVPRGSTDLPKLVVPQGARHARLQIGLEKGDVHKRFHVELRTAGGEAVWSQNNLAARAARAGRAVVLHLPVSVLNTGEYELALRGADDKGGVEDVGYYYFTVLKR
jgi:hypothetical protein